MVRVLHVIPAIPYGGAQRLVEQLASEQRRMGVDARVLALYSHETFLQNLELLGIPCHATGEHKAQSLRALLEINRYLQETDPKLLHLHQDLVWSTLWLGIRKQCPWVFHAHSYPPSGPGWKDLIRRKLLARYSDVIIGVSQSVTHAAKLYLSPGPSHYRTIYNGIAAPPLPEKSQEMWPAFMGDIAPGRPLIGMATRLFEDKGVSEFLEAISPIINELPQARFVIAGEGPLRQWLHKKQEEIGLVGVLALPGFIRDVGDFWAQLDFALFTSPREPFGLRIVEPQACGAVVVGYLNGSGSDEIIINGVSGSMVPWGDRQGLAEAVAFLWRNPAARESMAHAAYQLVTERFSLRRMTKECLDLYQQVLH